MLEVQLPTIQHQVINVSEEMVTMRIERPDVNNIIFAVSVAQFMNRLATIHVLQAHCLTKNLITVIMTILLPVKCVLTRQIFINNPHN